VEIGANDFPGADLLPSFARLGTSNATQQFSFKVQPLDITAGAPLHFFASVGGDAACAYLIGYDRIGSATLRPHSRPPIFLLPKKRAGPPRAGLINLQQLFYFNPYWN